MVGSVSAATKTVCSSGCDYTTIQSAITAASAADTISVGAGIYTGDLIIPTGKDNLIITGVDKATTIIKGVSNVAIISWPLAAPNIEILSSGVKIYGFTIESPNYEAGKYSSGIVIGASNVEIYGNNFKTAPGNDATADEVSQAIQTYSNLAKPGVDVSGLNIHDNSFTSLVSGISGYEGIYVNLDAGTGNITIDNNLFNGDLIRAISTERAHTQITLNTIITNFAPGIPGGYQGINVRITSTGNPLDVSVNGNTIKGVSAGKGFSKGVYVKSANGVLVNQNVITGNTVALDNDDTLELNAEYNYWGVTTSAEISALITGYVDYDPWYANETRTDLRNVGNVGGEGSDFISLTVPDSIAYGNLYSTPGFETTSKQITLTNTGSLAVTVTPVWSSGAEIFKRVKFSDDNTNFNKISSGEGTELVYSKNITATLVTSNPLVFSNPISVWTKIKIATGDTVAKLKGTQSGTIYFQAVEI